MDKLEFVEKKLSDIKVLKEIPLDDLEPNDKEEDFINSVVVSLFPSKETKSGKKIKIGCHFVYEKKLTGEIFSIDEKDLDISEIYKELREIIPEIVKLLENEKITIYDQKKRRGKLKKFILKGSKYKNEIIIGFITRDFAIAKKLAEKVKSIDNKIVGVVEHIKFEKVERLKTVLGQNYILEKINGQDFRLYFYPLEPFNIYHEQKVVDYILKNVEGGQIAVVENSKNGIIETFLAQKYKKVVVCEKKIPNYVSAKNNIETKDLVNVELRNISSSNILTLYPNANLFLVYDVEFDKEMKKEIINSKPENIFLFSFDFDKVVKNVRFLLSNGYTLEIIKPFEYIPSKNVFGLLCILHRK